jgi:Domain of unknown function (DUF4160)
MARFYGILVKLYFQDHGTPHFHAVYSEYNAVFDIETLEMMEGDLPGRAQKLVREWAERYQSDLLVMWELRNSSSCRGSINDRYHDIPENRLRSAAGGQAPPG